MLNFLKNKNVDLTWDRLKINDATVLYPSDIPAFGISLLMNQFEGIEIGRITFEKIEGIKVKKKNNDFQTFINLLIDSTETRKGAVAQG